MNMDGWRRALHGLENVKIGVTRVGRVNAALHAEFGGAALPGFSCSSCQLVIVEVIGAAAQIGVLTTLGKSAEAAGMLADIGVVDVAVHHIPDGAAACRCAHPVCGCADCFEFISARFEESGDHRFIEPITGFGACEQRLDRCAVRRAARCRFNG